MRFNENLRNSLEELKVHDHLCLIYETKKEQISTAIPFIKIGLQKGEQCIYIADDNTVAEILMVMRSDKINVNKFKKSGALKIITKKDAYLRNDIFDPDSMIEFLIKATQAAKKAGFSALRVTGEMTWSLGGDPGTDRLMEYESKLNHFFPKIDCLAICQYNRKRFSSKTILHVIRTHPLIIYGGRVCKNAYYVPPEEFSKPDQYSLEVKRLLKNIIEREKDKTEIERKNRAYHTLGQCNQILMRTNNESELLQEICQTLVDIGGYRLVWVGFAEHNKQKNVRPVSHVGYEEGYLEKLNITWSDTPRGCGPTGTAIRTKKPVIARNIHTDPKFTPWRREAEKRGYASSIALPLIASGKVFGALNIYSTLPDAFDKDEVRLLKELTGDLAYGIIALRTRIEHEQAEQTILTSETRYRELFDHINSGVAVYEAADNGRDFIFRDFNRAGQRIEKINKKSLIGKSVLQVFPGVKKFGLFDVFQRVWKTGKPEHHPVSFYKDKRIVGWRENYIYKLPSGEIVAVYDDITERRRAEEALRESEEKFRAIASLSPASIAILKSDKQGEQFLYVNTAWEMLTGYSRDDAILLKPNDMIHPDMRAQVAKQAAMRMRGENVLSKYEVKITTKSGEIRWVDFTATVIRYLGAPAILTIGFDITERKHTEMKLRESEEKYRKLINGMRDTAWVIDFNGNFIDVNNAAVEILGYTREELLSMGPLDIDSSLNVKTIKNLIKGMKTDKLQVFETTHTTKDGKIIPVEIQSTMITYQGKDAILSIARDITKRKQVEEALKESELKFKTIFDSASDGMFLIDSETKKFVMCNEACAKMLGVTQKEFLNLVVDDLHPPDEIPLILEGISEVMAGKKRNQRDIRFKRKNGTIFFSDLNPTLLSLIGKKYILIVFRDITERKQAEEQIQKDLLEKEILLKELYHRTKNNMQVISSMLRLKARYIKNEEVATSFKEIENKILTMALVHQKLYESKDLSRLNLKEYVNDLISLIKNSQLSSPDQVTFKMKGEAINVLIDTAIPIGLVINELITNALKYAFPDNRKGEIKINLFLTNKKGLVIEISDNGVGLPKEFDIQKDIHLGLEMVIDLVKHQLQGKINYQSKEGLSWHILLKEEVYKPRV